MSNFTSYDLKLSDGRPLVQIGNGDGLFAHPVTRGDILLGPAQTADVVVDFHGELGSNVVLASVPRVSNTHHGTGTPDTALMQFRVTRKTSDGGRVPATLEPPARLHAPKKPSFHWVLGRAGTGDSSQWTVNGRAFDPARVDVAVPLGSTRTWEISNSTSMTHYVHLHEEQWHTLSRDGRPPPPWERGLEDTWRLDPGESITVAARFTDYTGVFMIHCHMLDHEDHGMMAQFAVLPPGQTALPDGYYRSRNDSATSSTAGMSGMPGM
jgi:FtsP/CotA-like multicopper oxidase with cupredoxin domain